MANQMTQKRQISLFLFHFVATCFMLFIIGYHFLSETSKHLPGSRGFGLHWRYYTFISFSLQTIQFVSLTATDIARLLRRNPNPPKTEHMLDTLSSAMVCSSTIVSIMYYSLNALTKGGMNEGGRGARPEWLSASVHQAQCVVAWLELILASMVRIGYAEAQQGSPYARSFSKRALHFLIRLDVFYLFWISICAAMNGRYPYPFLDKPPTAPKMFACGVVMVSLTIVVMRLATALSRGIEDWVELGTRRLLHASKPVLLPKKKATRPSSASTWTPPPLVDESAMIHDDYSPRRATRSAVKSGKVGLL